MGLPRTFVGFSGTDTRSYRLMQAWKANEHIDFDFTDCQLETSIRSEDEAYIKRVCRERIEMAGTFIQLIGEDTRAKYKYVRWEAEVAVEKECRLIGVNLNRSRKLDAERCPRILRDVGTIFVDYSPKIIAYALEHWVRPKDRDWFYKPEIYRSLGYPAA